jgi:2-polyprenyl-3-methyl-5-hydroxy-6-metoxy-1,4-benzoquinol methylase
MSTRAPCTVCGSGRTSPDPFFYRWRGKRFDIRRCKACTHQFVWPEVTREEQAMIYSDAYFAEGGDWIQGPHRGTGYEDAESLLRREAGDVLSMLPDPPGRLLDIGCAGGAFLAEAQAKGFEVRGLEINPAMAAKARARGITVLNRRIEDAPLDRWPRFDVVTLMDVLEHLPDPRGAMWKVAHWLKPGGTLLVRGPVNDSRTARAKESLRRIVGAEKQLPGYPLDANCFNRRSLTTLLVSAGLTVRSWDGDAGFANVIAERDDEPLPPDEA